MKIAVTYDNGEIFQHFGKTESFKVYTHSVQYKLSATQKQGYLIR